MAKNNIFTNENIQKYLDIAIEVVLLILVLMAPLYFDRRIGIVFSLSKATWIRGLSIVIMALWATKYLAGRPKPAARTGLDFPILTFVLVSAAATVNSINVLISLVGAYGRFEGFITLVNCAALFFVVTNFFSEREKRRRIMILTVIVGVLMSVYGVIQRMSIDPYAWGGVVTNERIIATIGQPNFLAAYLCMAFLLGLALLFTLNDNNSVFYEIKEQLNKHLGKHQFKKNKHAQPAQKPKRKIELKWNEIAFNLKFVIAYIAVPSVFVYSIFRIESSIFFPAWLVTYAILIMFALYYAYNFEKLDKRVSSAVLVLSLVLVFGGILSTQSRGGWIGFLCAIAVFIMITGRVSFFENRWKWASLAGGLLAALAISLMFLGAGQSTRFLNEVQIQQGEGAAAAKLETQGAAGSRIETWTSATAVTADKPLLGTGQEVIKMVFPRYETELFRFKEAFHVKQDRCHNEVFDIAVTRGYLGLAVYIWLLFSVFRLCLGQLKREGTDKIFIAGVAGALVSYIVQNQFSFGVVAITSIFWIIMGMSVPIYDVQPRTEPTGSPVKIKWELVVLLWAAVAGLLVISAFPYIGDKYFKTAQTIDPSAQPELSAKNFELALKHSPYESGFYTHYGMSILNSERGRAQDVPWLEKAVQIYEKGQKVDPYNADNFYMAGRACLILWAKGQESYLFSAEAYSLRAIKIDPYYAEAYQTLGYIYERKGDPEKAVKMYEKTFLINPGYTDMALAVYNHYKRKGDPEKAFKVFDSALELNPGNPELLMLFGDLYIELDKPDKALARYRQALALNSRDVRAMTGSGMAMLKKGDLKGAFGIFQEAMMIDPASPVLHNGLGTYYLRTGDRAKARQEFEQALSFDPGNQYAASMLSRLR